MCKLWISSDNPEILPENLVCVHAKHQEFQSQKDVHIEVQNTVPKIHLTTTTKRKEKRIPPTSDTPTHIRIVLA